MKPVNLRQLPHRLDRPKTNCVREKKSGCAAKKKPAAKGRAGKAGKANKAKGPRGKISPSKTPASKRKYSEPPRSKAKYYYDDDEEEEEDDYDDEDDYYDVSGTRRCVLTEISGENPTASFCGP